LLRIAKLGTGKTLMIVGGAMLFTKIVGFVGFIIAMAVIGLGDWKLARTQLAEPPGEV